MKNFWQDPRAAFDCGLSGDYVRRPISMLFSAINPNFLRLTEKWSAAKRGRQWFRLTTHVRARTCFEMYCIDVEGQRSKDDVILLAVGVLF